MPVTSEARSVFPERARASLPDRPLGIYVHVPFCATRCGYCDFNTYTAGELGTSASPGSWFGALSRELELAVEACGPGAPAASTVFIGGGTPSLLGAEMLGDVLGVIRRTVGLVEGAEVTTESNPESTSPGFFGSLREAGFTRVSLGMQSVAPHVLAVLDRTHTPGRAVAAAGEARAAGFEHVNLDMIYGTPGETDADLAATLDAVLDAGVDHVSAYALIVEEGTALARRVRKGVVPAPDDDVLAARYELIDDRLSGAGLEWYEVSNWASGPDAQCQHNLGYWNGDNWWGAGPGAHGHLGGIRWWNAKHPARYAESLGQDELPIAGQEELTAEDQHLEQIMLQVRMRSGLDLALLADPELEAARACIREGLGTEAGGRLVLTGRGRLLADAVVRRIAAAS
ncbi:radical SAM family heme chaperone HemW [Lolliginicoccus levis]|uniref:radical SAM family heme chaperone HemW n=1 Tax=Lolliginicoccus levis TaxID=2919542 RepID=UPI0035A226F6